MQDCYMKTYHRLPVVFTRGEGAYLFDASGKKYLDMTAGIAVNCLGHRHPALLEVIRTQSEKLIHVCNYYQSDIALVFAEKLTRAAGMKNVFLSNSGAEANEGACKIARKYSLKKHGEGRHTIVSLRGSFHGRTITTLAATGQDSFHKNFGPFTEGFRFVQGGDIDALDKALDASVAGLLIEVVQGESGVHPQTQEYIKAAARFCRDRDILLMFDEVQCGLGRTGKFLACEHYGVKPDLVTLAKGLAGGIPIGAVLAGEKTADVFETGDHGSTFGGNPLAAACANAVLDIVTEKNFLDSITDTGNYLMDGLKSLKNSKGQAPISAVRGLGLIVGADLSVNARPVLEKALENSLLVLSAGEKTLRFVPPYIITKAQIDEALAILRTIL
ncbi:MAG: aspartate aminotransferase family protein [Termitinemataceae bacterium]|nr:MAG: aspartate aminotransferase family protein [Termitinemataceae bacterium]